MREFLVVGHEAPTTPEFSLSDLPGVGRLDLLCRCATVALLVSHGIREAVTVRIVLQDSFTLRIESDEVRNLRPDERSTAALIRTALEEREGAIGHQPVETSPGVFLTRRGFDETLEAVAAEGTVIQCHEDGTPATEVEVPEHPVFVLSDHREFTAAETATLESTGADRLRLGPVALHADQAITVAHNWVDTRGYASYESGTGT